MNHSLLTIAIIVIAIVLVFRIIDQRNTIEVLVSDLDYATDEIELLEDALYNMPIYVYRITPDIPNDVIYIRSHVPDQTPDDYEGYMEQLSDADATLYMRGLL